MTAAFETVCQSITPRVNGDDGMRKAVALAILKYLDLGERDPARLSELALNQLMGVEGSDRRL